MKLSVTLATYYADKDIIGRCLDSVMDLADEIIVVYGQKDNEPAPISKEYKAKVVAAPNEYQNFHIMKKQANDLATGDWIFQIDTDEVVTPKLKEEIRSQIDSNPKENGFWIPRANFFLGRFLKKGGAYPDYTLRLYRKDKGNLPAVHVHEQAKVEGKIGYLKNDLLHYNNPTFAVYLDKRLNHYTDIMAGEVRGGFVENIFIKPLFDSRQGFLTIYFRHLGFLDGFPGFIWALFSALHIPIAYFKSLENKL